YKLLKILKTYKGMVVYEESYLYVFLVNAALFKSSKYYKKIKMKYYFNRIRKKIDFWAKECPINYFHHKLIIEAEYASMNNKFSEATTLYEEAINEAQKNGYIEDEALFNELAGKFYLLYKKSFLAGFYFKKAHYLYLHWGAVSKARHIEEVYPELIERYENQDITLDKISKTSTNIQEFDFYSLMNISQAISGEVNLSNVLKILVREIIKNTGAQKAFLIIRNYKDNKFYIQASNEKDINTTIENPVVYESSLNICKAIINFVIRSSEVVILDNAKTDNIYAEDKYLKSNSVKSILCVPILFKGYLKGVIYLENNLAEGVFTKERIDIIKILASQAAIAFENSVLYTNLEEKVALRTNELETAKNVLEKTNIKLENAKIEAEKANEFKTKFFAQMSHDLRTPLHVIIGSLDYLTKMEEVSKNIIISKSINMALRSGERQLELVNTILDLSKIEAGKIELNIEKIKLNDLFIGLHEQMDTLLKGKDIKFHLENTIENENLIIEIDKLRISQVITNLLSNAAKFTETGEIRLFVRCSSCLVKDTNKTRNEERIYFEVFDTGIGMSLGNTARVFESYTMIETALQQRLQGTGLGLSICKGIIEAHNGKIAVESELGQGSIFVFWVPLTIAQHPTSDGRRQMIATRISDAINFEKLKQKKILLCDDDDFNRTFAQIILENKVNCIFTESGEKSIEVLNKEKFDLVFMDLNMPNGIDGRTTFKEIRKFDQKTPIVALTAEAMEGTKEELQQLGFDGYISKPFKENEIIMFLAHHFGLLN
ncbi:response regulator, partial [Candidatus Margulisiibacteriota bacterium]